MKSLDLEYLHSLVEDSFKDASNNFSLLYQSNNIKNALINAVNTITASYIKGGCLFVAGNGGSAADAQHLVAELIVRLSKDRSPIKAFAMTVDTSILTAIGNDYNYDVIFERQVRGLMTAKDVFLGITTSGNSKNILNAFQACQEIGSKSILLSGKEGGASCKMADHVILAPGKNTARIQEAHIAIYHTLCLLLEQQLAENNLVHFK